MSRRQTRGRDHRSGVRRQRRHQRKHFRTPNVLRPRFWEQYSHWKPRERPLQPVPREPFQSTEPVIHQNFEEMPGIQSVDWTVQSEITNGTNRESFPLSVPEIPQNFELEPNIQSVDWTVESDIISGTDSDTIIGPTIESLSGPTSESSEDSESEDDSSDESTQESAPIQVNTPQKWSFSANLSSDLIHYYHDIQTRLTSKGITARDCDDLYRTGNISYVFDKLIGKGTFSKVFSGFVAGQQANKVAIKVIKPKKSYQEIALKDEIECINILMERPHHNIIHYWEHFESVYYSNRTHFFISDLSTSDLYNVLCRRNKSTKKKVWTRLKPQYCRHLIQSIVSGVYHIHSLGIAHGDIKLENILIKEQIPNEINRLSDLLENRVMNMTPKLTDFSNSFVGVPGKPILCDYPTCTIYTAAPESWYSRTSYDMITADIYSIGVLLLSMLLGCHPFAANIRYRRQPNEGYNRITNNYKNDRNLLKYLVQSFDYPLKQLLLRTLEPKPKNRIRMEEFLADQWFIQPISHQEYENRLESPLRKGLPQNQRVIRECDDTLLIGE